MIFFSVKTLCGLVCRRNISEKHAVSIFRSEVISWYSDGSYVYINICRERVAGGEV
jgi:hypothetical protein